MGCHELAASKKLCCSHVQGIDDGISVMHLLDQECLVNDILFICVVVL